MKSFSPITEGFQPTRTTFLRLDRKNPPIPLWYKLIKTIQKQFASLTIKQSGISVHLSQPNFFKVNHITVYHEQTSTAQGRQIVQKKKKKSEVWPQQMHLKRQLRVCKLSTFINNMYCDTQIKITLYVIKVNSFYLMNMYPFITDVYLLCHGHACWRPLTYISSMGIKNPYF